MEKFICLHIVGRRSQYIDREGVLIRNSVSIKQVLCLELYFYRIWNMCFGTVKLVEQNYSYFVCVLCLWLHWYKSGCPYVMISTFLLRCIKLKLWEILITNLQHLVILNRHHCRNNFYKFLSSWICFLNVNTVHQVLATTVVNITKPVF